MVRLRLPAKIRPGTYKLTWVARSGTETVSRTIRLTLVGAAAAQVKPKRSELEVVLAGETPPGRRTPAGPGRDAAAPQLGERRRSDLRPHRLDPHEVGVVVVDADAYGTRLHLRSPRCLPEGARDRDLARARPPRAGGSRRRQRLRSRATRPPRQLAKAIALVAAPLDGGLHREDDADDHEHDAEREPQRVLVDRPVALAPSQPPGIAPASPASRIGQSTPSLARVRREAGDAEEEADDEVRPRRALDVHADAADERRHPQRAEDDADGAAERADAEPPATAGQSRRRSRVRACTGRSARSIPLQTSTAAIAA